jgi:formylglycine-generating enzyme required for sulfatase activity/serine/threonine protein phosphatase PrpC
VELSLEISGAQIAGARDYQEDAFLTTYLDDESGDSKSSALVIVADGMGGHAAGNIASNLVVSTVNTTFTGKFGKQDPPGALRAALEKANDGLKTSIKETPGLDGMGCTMVSAAIVKGKIFWVSVGDSHIYLIRDRALNKKNEDHSYGGYLDRMQSQGIEVEAEAGLSRNMLMSAMTGEEIAEVDCPALGFQLLPGDRLIIATDGLDTLEAETILKTSTWAHTSKECVAGLLNAVDDAKRPRQDNATVVVVDVTERPPAKVQAAPAAAAVAVPPPRAEFARVHDLPADASGGNKGLIIGLILLLVVGAGGGYVYMTGMWRGWMEEPLVSIRLQPAPPAQQQPAQQEPVQQPAQQEPVQQPAQQEPVQQPAQQEPVQQPAQQEPVQQPAQQEPVQQPAQQEPVQPEPPQPVHLPPTAVRQFQDALTSGGVGPMMAEIPAGSFEMGSRNYSVEVTERPQRTVNVPGFAMGMQEVTFAEYERFARGTGRKVPRNPGRVDKKTHPVIFVSWDDAVAYTKWLSNQTGKKYVLPSEAQWEYAALGDTSSRFWWGRELGSGRAHCFDCDTGLNPRAVTRVGRFPANLFGLHDTAGNVSEWVRDCWHPNYQDAPTDGSVWDGGDCSYRVARGGSFLNTGTSIRPKTRTRWKSQQSFDSVGFRVVREL